MRVRQCLWAASFAIATTPVINAWSRTTLPNNTADRSSQAENPAWQYNEALKERLGGYIHPSSVADQLVD